MYPETVEWKGFSYNGWTLHSANVDCVEFKKCFYCDVDDDTQNSYILPVYNSTHYIFTKLKGAVIATASEYNFNSTCASNAREVLFIVYM